MACVSPSRKPASVALKIFKLALKLLPIRISSKLVLMAVKLNKLNANKNTKLIIKIAPDWQLDFVMPAQAGIQVILSLRGVFLQNTSMCFAFRVAGATKFVPDEFFAMTILDT